MIQPNPEVDELVELLNGLEFIEDLAKLGRGFDDASNTALKSIRVRTQRLIEVLRSLDETNMFGPDELGQRMIGSPANKGDL